MELLCKNHSLLDLILIPSFCYGLGFQSRLMGWTLAADRIWCWKLLKEEEVGLGEEPSTFFPYCSPLWCSAPAACGQLVLPLLSSWLQSTQVSETAWIRTFSPTPALHLHPNFDVHLLKRSRRLFNRSSKTSVVILAACQGFMEKIKSSFFFFFYSFIFSRGCWADKDLALGSISQVYS